jgi:uncharacterized protein with FMN-binding domain
MRRITLAVLGTLTVLVLLFSYHTSTSSRFTTTAQAPTSGSSQASGRTYTGDSVDTRWGPVQVQITVESGRITAAEAVVYPNENPRDQEINSYAVPALNSEVVRNQGANIDAVSGATVTSDGYVRSLQSAIDQANL